MGVKYALLVSLFYFCWSQASYAQNLVPNPSFEDHSACPWQLDQVQFCVNWNSFGNSPDYFSNCGIPGFSLPNVGTGYQYPHSGNFVMGLVQIRKDTTPGANYREFIGAELSTPTIIGQKYFLSFYCNNSGVYGISSNKIGAKLSTVPFDSCCPVPLSNTAHMYTDSIITDTLNWTYVTGSFIADSVYNYIILGNFFNDSQTDTLNYYTTGSNSYMYIDDICLSTDSLHCQTWTSLNQIEYNQISIFPNPTFDNISVESLEPITYVKIYNSIGVLVSERTNNSRKLLLHLENLTSGIYFLNFRINGEYFRSKIVRL